MPIERSPNPKQQDDEQNSEIFRGFRSDEMGAAGMTRSKELAAVCRQHNQVQQKVVRIRNVLRDESGMVLAQLNVISKNLSAAYTEFSGFHSEMMVLITDDEVSEEEVYEQFEKLYNFVSTIVEDRILTAKAHSLVPSPASSQMIIQQQPLKMPIPTFSGDYSACPKFKAIFQDLMAKSGDSDAIKLYHLDKALIGSAAGVLDAKILSEGNYSQAWDVLTERFENERVIVESHIRGLLNLQRMSAETYKDLRSLLDEATWHIESLRFLKQELTGVSEHMVVYLISNALDNSTRKAWEASLKRAELPKYDPTIAFLKSRCQILENCETASRPLSHQPKPKNPPMPVKMPLHRSHTAVAKPAEMKFPVNVCVFCGGQHLNFQCNKLNDLSAAQKIEKVKASGICFNCFRRGHRSKDCPSEKTCRKCQKRHHTQLHDDAEAATREVSLSSSVPNEQADAPKIVAPEIESISTTCSGNHTQATKTVLLLTAVINVFDRKNELHPCRVLLDSGSQVNFITERMANLLAIPKQRAMVPIIGINALRTHAKDKIKVHFCSRYYDYHNQLECLIIPKITEPIPTTKIDITHWNIPNGFILADPEFHTPAKVDLLIGAELFCDLIKPGHLQLAENLPKLRETSLGWIVAGAVEANLLPASLQHANLVSVGDVDDWMRRFWEIEDVPNVSKYSSEQQACEEHFKNTCRRNESSRFIVRLLFKENFFQLTDNRALALKRFSFLEKRLQRDPNLKVQYQDFIREYESLGHCHEIDESKDPPDVRMYYMPHHAIIRPSSSSTKCRVVFDASAKPKPSAKSLNDVLMVGPVVQDDLFSIMLRFRKYKENDGNDMDDALSGADALYEAVEIRHQLQTLLNRGGFTIHKWCSNSDAFRDIPEQCREKKMPVPEYGANEVIKLLGLLWDPRNDIFLIVNTHHQPPTRDFITKRIIYSEVARLFDPIGLISPVIVLAKLLVQQLWKKKAE
ncbi:uncharacterized protein LOC128740109 [Sabethes cyaneus]|uniref:uncharacterized protein LOC128740109 n=1 Tax=Sabethes cyaneus TaxID=53552 RepID=UPI00237DA1F2|nr:uncharacterized protein LOC128740109 [Sabethes cyaneus]